MRLFKRKKDVAVEATTVHALAVKASRETKYGILFHRKDPNSPLTIKEVRKAGVFYMSGLESGMIAMEINGLESFRMSPKEAARALRSAKVGTQIWIVGAAPLSVRIKRLRDSPWGFAVKNSTTKSIKPFSLAEIGDRDCKVKGH